MIVGAGFGFVQWRYLLRDTNVSDNWIMLATIGWTVGAPLAYLSYRILLDDMIVHRLPTPLQTMPEIIIYAWTFVLSEAITRSSAKWLFGTSMHRLQTIPAVVPE